MKKFFHLLSKPIKWVIKQLKTLTDSSSPNLIRFQSLLSLCISIIIIFALFSFATIYATSALEPDLSSNGWKHFTDLFDFPLKALAIVILLFTIWVTLERTIMTDRSIDVMTENNKFNNFFTHRKEFSQYFLESEIISILVNSSQRSAQEIINQLYAAFYTDRYQNFNPEINRGGIKLISEINKFFYDNRDSLEYSDSARGYRSFADVYNSNKDRYDFEFLFSVELKVKSSFHRKRVEDYFIDKHGIKNIDFEIHFEIIRMYINLIICENISEFHGGLMKTLPPIEQTEFKIFFGSYIFLLGLNKDLDPSGWDALKSDS